MTIISISTMDANSSINIMKLTKCCIERQTHAAEFHMKFSSFTSSNKKKEEKVRPS